MTGRTDFSTVGRTIARRTAWDCENRSGINERIAWRSAVKSRGRSQLKNRSYSYLLSDDCRHPAGSNSRDTMRLVRLSSMAAVRLHLSLYCLICCLHLCLINSNLACVTWLKQVTLTHTSLWYIAVFYTVSRKQSTFLTALTNFLNGNFRNITEETVFGKNISIQFS